MSEEVRGVQQFWWVDVTFNERYRLTTTAEASDSCVSDGYKTTVTNGKTQWYFIPEWWQITKTEYKYKSNDPKCSCRLTDYKTETTETPYLHAGNEAL